MNHRKPKPKGFVGCVEVLTWLHEFKDVDHWTLGRLLQGQKRNTVQVLRRCVRLGWAQCLQRPGRGRWGPPGRYAITAAGQRRIGRDGEPSGERAEGRRRNEE